MSTETRTIRPFTGLGDLENVLEGITLHFGRDRVPANGGITVDFPPHEFLLRPVSVEWEWGADSEAFDQFKARLVNGAARADIPLDSLALVVVASSTFLKIADIVFTCPVENIEQLTPITALTEPTRPQAFDAPYSGFKVDTYLLLNRELPFRALRPHRLGTWIARAQFRVETTQGPAVLPPTPLTDGVRARYRLPAKTVRFLDFREHNVLEPYAEQEPPAFYVDEKLLAQMNARRNSPASKALQLQLAIDFITAVIRRASASDDLVGLRYDDLRATLLGNAIRVAAGPNPSEKDLDNLVTKVKETPEYVIARAEHFVDIQSGFIGCLEDVES